MEEKTALVVGGAGGIGKACVELFQNQGHKVIILDKSLGHDACNSADVREVLQDVANIDILVHAAGSVGRGGIDEGNVEQWKQVIDDNLTSALVVCQEALPLMTRGGSVILFSSVNGRHGGNRLSGPAYAMAKAGIIGLSRHLAKDQAAHGIRVNAIAPGPVATPMLDRLESNEVDRLVDQIPLGHIAEPSEIAGAVNWLSSSEASSVTGIVLDINGGMWMG